MSAYGVGEELLNTDAAASSQSGGSADAKENEKTATTGDLTEKNTVIETRSGLVNDDDIKCYRDDESIVRIISSRKATQKEQEAYFRGI